MELLVEMDSSLNTAHFFERQADEASSMGRFDDALKFYDKAILHMERARRELEDDDFTVDVIDLQLSFLKENRERTLSQKNTALMLAKLDKVYNGSYSPSCRKTIARSVSPVCSELSDTEPPVAVKCPKSALQTREELETCVAELRQVIDKLSIKLEETHRELSEERARRLAAEAELLTTRLWSTNISPSKSPTSVQNGFAYSETQKPTETQPSTPVPNDDPVSGLEQSLWDASFGQNSSEFWFDAHSKLP